MKSSADRSSPLPSWCAIVLREPNGLYGGLGDGLDHFEQRVALAAPAPAFMAVCITGAARNCAAKVNRVTALLSIVLDHLI